MSSPEANERQFTLRDVAVSWRDVDGEIIALDVESGAYLMLEGSGRLLWLALVEPVSRADLAGLLQDEFDIPNERAVADVAVFVEDLVERGLVEAVA